MTVCVMRDMTMSTHMAFSSWTSMAVPSRLIGDGCCHVFKAKDWPAAEGVARACASASAMPRAHRLSGERGFGAAGAEGPSTDRGVTTRGNTRAVYLLCTVRLLSLTPNSLSTNLSAITPLFLETVAALVRTSIERLPFGRQISARLCLPFGRQF